MCFDIKLQEGASKPDVLKPQVAKRNINVWKVLLNNNYGVFNSLYINGKFEKWKPGTHYTETTPFATIRVYENWGVWRLQVNGDAFHSHITKISAKQQMNNNSYNRKMVRMVIPKGATYYKNSVHYVSSDLIYPYKEAK